MKTWAKWTLGIGGGAAILFALLFGAGALGAGIFFLVSNPFGWAVTSWMFLTVVISSTVIGGTLFAVALAALTVASFALITSAIKKLFSSFKSKQDEDDF